jgi:hypothetical protein
MPEYTFVQTFDSSSVLVASRCRVFDSVLILDNAPNLLLVPL